MAKKITQKQLKHDEFVDAAFDFGHWLEQNWATAVKWVVGALVLVLAVVGWVAYSRHRDTQLKNSLARGIHSYEQVERGSTADPAGLEAALKIFEDAARRGGSAPTGRLAEYYEGATLHRLGRLEEAAAALQQVVDRAAPGETLGGSARLLLARVHVDAGEREKGIGLIESMVEQEASAVPPDLALLELGRIHQDAGDSEQARVVWQRIVDEHPRTASAAEARSLLR